MSRVRLYQAFTLLEIAFSLAIIAGVVITVMLLLANVQKTLQTSRMGVFAAAIATNLMQDFQQQQEDLREPQDDNAPFSTGHVNNIDGTYNVNNPIVRKPNVRLSGVGALYGVAGLNDWEIRAIADKTIVPIPNSIARRLDSPGDEIGKMLDAGGRLYYCAPGEGNAVQVTSSSGNRGRPPELNRLVFGVIGHAQQNLLPTHPLIMLERRMYPFPPYGMDLFDVPQYASGLGGTGMMPRRWASRRDYTASGLLAITRSASSTSVTAGALSAADSPAPTTSPQASSWELHGYIDVQSMPTGSSPWARSLPHFWRLVNYHWNRIDHQLGAYQYQIGAGSQTITLQRPKYKTVTRTVEEQQVSYDQYRRPTYTTVTRTYQEQVEDGTENYSQTISGNLISLRGVPSPPNGLPMAQGLRGTDILYEDAETLAKDRWNQMRVGLPGLERRVMYRTAALALWAKADDGTELMKANPAVLGTASDVLTSNPNICDNAPAAWSDPTNPACRNPLLRIIPPPANARDIHPTQVLALSYLAHAAVLVTGYKPPFINSNNSLDKSQHEDLVSDETAPYKDPDTSQWFYLYHPFYVASGAASATSTDSENPATSPLSAVTVEACLDTSGAAIQYRRFPANAPVRNPFPGPYADRGAFNWKGEAAWTRDAGTLVLTSHGAYPTGTGFTAADPSDTQMARIAMENALAWAMAYVREHPYDLIVPKPLNAPVSTDRPVFAMALFDGSGNALRTKPTSWSDDTQCIPRVIWGSDRALWPLQLGNIVRIFSFAQMRATSGVCNVTSGAANPIIDATHLNPLALGSYAQATETQNWGDLKPINGHSRSFTRSDNGLASLVEQHYWAGKAHPSSVGTSAYAKTGAGWRDRVSTSPRQSHWWYDTKTSTQVQDRTRQLVFWSVDWQAFEDAESQPSEPVDLSFWSLSMEDRSENPGTVRSQTLPLMRRGHPEQSLMWANPVRDATTRSQPMKDVVQKALQPPSMSMQQYWFDTRSNHLGSGISLTNIMYSFGDPMPWSRLGTWGADRNANGIWDRGRIPANTRMKALEVARFPFYDTVLWTTLGN